MYAYRTTALPAEVEEIRAILRQAAADRARRRHAAEITAGLCPISKSQECPRLLLRDHAVHSSHFHGGK